MDERFQRALFGTVRFREDEEYLAFRYRFLIIIIWVAALCTGLFVIGDALGLNTLSPVHMVTADTFTALSPVLALLLRGHRRRFWPIAITFTTACFIHFSSALLFVPNDELRVVWYILYVPAVYIVLGRRAGLITSVATIAFVLGCSPWLSAPLSSNARSTFVIALIVANLIYYAYTARSISAFARMAELNRMLRDRATHDSLTGLLNAHAFYEAADAAIGQCRRTGDAYSVLFIDLDHFKRINDRFGHRAGDDVLRAVARCLSENVRGPAILGRVGGEEFTILLPHVTGVVAHGIAETLRKAIAHRVTVWDGRRLPITASIGVADNAARDEDITAIQHRADTAMYLAKRAGRNTVIRIDADVVGDVETVPGAQDAINDPGTPAADQVATAGGV